MLEKIAREEVLVVFTWYETRVKENIFLKKTEKRLKLEVPQILKKNSLLKMYIRGTSKVNTIICLIPQVTIKIYLKKLNLGNIFRLKK